MKRTGLFFITLLMGLVLLVGCNQESSDSEVEAGGETLENVYLNLGATSQSSGLYAYMVAIANGVEEETDGKIDMTVVETGASVDNLKRLQQESIDLGLGTESVNVAAMEGKGEWEEAPIPDVRNLFTFLPISQPYTVTEESEVNSISDLDSKTFFPGFTGSATEATTQEILDALGVKPDYFLGGLEDGVNALKDRRAVGMVKTGLGVDPDPTVIEINATLPMKIIGFTEEEKDIIQSEVGLPFTTIPAGSYPNQEEDVETPVLVMDIFASTRMSEEVAYNIVKAAVETKEAQENAYSGVKGIDYIEATLEFATTPLHVGAIKYFEEIGAEVPEHLIPPENK
ncbi:TAXI family TRAP transporter solute-binding subunit [Planococcus salinus]|nr:TAXI family TRAP transporter solute-binding subunit [Planococcus salinus]